MKIKIKEGLDNIYLRVLLSATLLVGAVVIGYNSFSSKNNDTLANPISKTETLQNNKINEKENKTEKESLVNLNTASKDELETLKGIGNVVSQRIIDYRETHGGFLNKEEIVNVKGIGTATFDNIKNNITV